MLYPSLLVYEKLRSSEQRELLNITTIFILYMSSKNNASPQINKKSPVDTR